MPRDLHARLVELAREPRHADFAQRLLEALGDIRRDFHGAARTELEALVDEAIARQLERIESRERAEAALAELQTSQAELVQALYGLLLRLVPDEGATRH